MTGESDHLVGAIDKQGCPVGMPDKGHTQETKEGTVTLQDDLILKNVLYVPGLKCSLISISQLIDACQCYVQFTNILCIIQDYTSRTVIGADKRRDRLYYFQSLPRPKAMKVE